MASDTKGCGVKVAAEIGKDHGWVATRKTPPAAAILRSACTKAAWFGVLFQLRRQPFD
jgi:hypothetical protein